MKFAVPSIWSKWHVLMNLFYTMHIRIKVKYLHFWTFLKRGVPYSVWLFCDVETNLQRLLYLLIVPRSLSEEYKFCVEVCSSCFLFIQLMISVFFKLFEVYWLVKPLALVALSDVQASFWCRALKIGLCLCVCTYEYFKLLSSILCIFKHSETDHHILYNKIMSPVFHLKKLDDHYPVLETSQFLVLFNAVSRNSQYFMCKCF